MTDVRKKHEKWDAVAQCMRGRGYYFNQPLSFYKRGEFLKILAGYKGEYFSRVLKTDVFEEAYGREDIVRYLSARSKTVYCADISHEIISDARQKRYKNAAYVCQNINEFSFRSNTFDFVFSSSTLGYADSVSRAVGETYRVLIPGGRAVLSFNNKMNIGFRIMTCICMIFRIVPFSMSKSFTPRELERILQERGFRIERTEPIVHVLPFQQMLIHVLRKLRCEKGAVNLITRYSNSTLRLKKYTAWFYAFCVVKEA
mgnify:CR=1 FL=1